MKDLSYWQQTSISRIVSSEYSVLAYEELLLQAYSVALINIKKSINVFFAKYTEDIEIPSADETKPSYVKKIPYASVRKRLTDTERKDLNVMLREWYKAAMDLGLSAEYKKFLQALGEQKYITRLEYLESSIRYEIETMKQKQHDDFVPVMQQNYIYAYYTSYYTTYIGMESAAPLEVLEARNVEAAIKTRWNGKNFSDRIWQDKAKLVDTLTRILPRSFSQGFNGDTLGDLLAKELNVSRNAGRTLARTEINRMCNQASLDMYKAIGIRKYQFLATLDMRTSDICRSLDQFIGLVSQAVVDVNYPPMHPNCRSTTVPFFEEDKSTPPEERIARDEQGSNIRVPRRMSQEDWINTYVPEAQRADLLKFKKKYGNPPE